MALEDMRRLVGMLRSIRELAGDFPHVAAKADALEAAGSPSEPGGPVGQPPALTPRGWRMNSLAGRPEAVGSIPAR